VGAILIAQGVLDREVYEARNQQFFEQYKAGTLDIHEFWIFNLSHCPAIRANNSRIGIGVHAPTHSPHHHAKRETL
jgi:hypothetical protein